MWQPNHFGLHMGMSLCESGHEHAKTIANSVDKLTRQDEIMITQHESQWCRWKNRERGYFEWCYSYIRATSWSSMSFFPRECLRRVLRKKAAVILHLHIFTSADLDLHTFTSADLHLHTLIPADLDLHTFTPADLDLHTFTSADLHLHTFTPADLHLHTFTSADLHLHTLTSADLHLHTPWHLQI